MPTQAQMQKTKEKDRGNPFSPHFDFRVWVKENKKYGDKNLIKMHKENKKAVDAAFDGNRKALRRMLDEGLKPAKPSKQTFTPAPEHSVEREALNREARRLLWRSGFFRGENTELWARIMPIEPKDELVRERLKALRTKQEQAEVYSGAKVSWEEASALGHARYFTGLPCNHGHVAQRYVSTRLCVLCVKYREHRDEGRAERLAEVAHLIPRKKRKAK